MNKIILNTGLLCLLFPLMAYALGLGDMTVHSSLNQPFDAEITLIDARDIPLSEIKASLASVEDFERIGLERAYVLDLLIFRVAKNKSGTPVVQINSIERISEPYLELLVDLAWADGQVYRAYTVLLDPPQYQLKTVKTYHPAHNQSAQKPVRSEERQEVKSASHKEYFAEPAKKIRKEATYGPTLAKETIWQIAQRYKMSDVSLQQVILAIVGANPDAFSEGNVNGLKKGVQLTIPAVDTIKKIPESLAKTEIQRHDAAWQTKKPIDHLLRPPYYQDDSVNNMAQKILKEPILASALAQIPELSTVQSNQDDFISGLFKRAPANLSAQEDVASKAQAPGTSLQSLAQDKMQAEMHVAAVAIESVRESNALLNKQIFMLQEQGLNLQKKLAQREDEIKRLQQEIRILKTRQGLAGQASALPNTEKEYGIWLWILMFILIATLALVLYWWFYLQSSKNAVENNIIKAKKSLKSLLPFIIPLRVKREKASEEISEPQSTDLTSEQNQFEAPDQFEASQPLSRKTPVVFPPEKSSQTEESASISEQESQKEINQDTSPKEQEEEHILEFESGLDKVNQSDTDRPSDIEIKDEKKDESLIEYEPYADEAEVQPQANIGTHDLPDILDERSIEPELEPELEPESQGKPHEADKPLKSSRALQTLLDLAKTYIDIEDYEAAKQSLEEVIEFGTDEQKEKAMHLMARLYKK